MTRFVTLAGPMLPISVLLMACGADAPESGTPGLRIDKHVVIGPRRYTGDLAMLPDGALIATHSTGTQTVDVQVVSIVNADGTPRWSHELPHAGARMGQNIPGSISPAKGQRVAISYMWSRQAPLRCSYLLAEGSGTVISEVPDGSCPEAVSPIDFAPPVATDDGRIWLSRLDPDVADRQWILSAVEQTGPAPAKAPIIGPATALAAGGMMFYAATITEDFENHELVAVEQSGQVQWRLPYGADLFVQKMIATADGLWLSERNIDNTRGRLRHLDRNGVELWSRELGAGAIQFSIAPRGDVLVAIWALSPDTARHCVQLDTTTGAVLSEDLVDWIGGPTSVAIFGQDDVWEHAFGTLYHYSRSE